MVETQCQSCGEELTGESLGAFLCGACAESMKTLKYAELDKAFDDAKLWKPVCFCCPENMPPSLCPDWECPSPLPTAQQYATAYTSMMATAAPAPLKWTSKTSTSPAFRRLSVLQGQIGVSDNEDAAAGGGRSVPPSPSSSSLKPSAVVADAKQGAVSAVDAELGALKEVSMAIWRNPELNYEERFAHDELTKFLEQRDFKVERQYLGLETAFRATLPEGNTTGPKIAVLLEYDALPGIGHACGHNLIAEAGLAAVLGVKQALPTANLVVLGTPAEEGGGGKVEMIRKGAFEGIDAAMMVHPAPADLMYFKSLAICQCTVKYHGRNAHAAASPWQGLNALDAMIAAFNGISLARQQMKPDWRVHGVIHKGGEKPNIIPDLTEAEFYVRAPDDKELKDLRARVINVFQGAAVQTGTECEIDWGPSSSVYAQVITNTPMADLYRENAMSLGKRLRTKEEEEKAGGQGGSTDMGNVSFVVPTIHPMFKINAKYGNHHPAFTEFAGSDDGHAQAIIAGKSMAMTCLDLFLQDGVMDQVKKDFTPRTFAFA